jgi:hypothetical protein
VDGGGIEGFWSEIFGEMGAGFQFVLPGRAFIFVWEFTL